MDADFSDLLLFDTHVHLNATAFDADRAEVEARTFGRGVRAVVNIGPLESPDDNARGLAYARAHPRMYATIGVHPHFAAAYDPSRHRAELSALCADDRVVAVGEVGLDYHYDFSPRDVQRRCFEDFIAVAVEQNLPLVLHSREAAADTLAVLRSAGAERVGGIFHCYGYDVRVLDEVLALGFSIGIGGVVTFPKAVDLHEAARRVPADRYVLETDCPYLAPVPLRGRRCEPWMTGYVAQAVARLRGETPADVARTAFDNACRLFGLDAAAVREGAPRGAA